MIVESLASLRAVDYESRRTIHDGVRAFREARETASRSVRRDIGEAGESTGKEAADSDAAGFDPTFFSTARRRWKASVRAPPEKCGSGAFTKTD